MSSAPKTIRKLLREVDDGLTIASISERTGHSHNVVWKALRRMPDSYVDRWIKSTKGAGRHAAVWCVVVPPEDCPRPTGAKT